MNMWGRDGAASARAADERRCAHDEQPRFISVAIRQHSPSSIAPFARSHSPTPHLQPSLSVACPAEDRWGQRTRFVGPRLSQEGSWSVLVSRGPSWTWRASRTSVRAASEGLRCLSTVQPCKSASMRDSTRPAGSCRLPSADSDFTDHTAHKHRGRRQSQTDQTDQAIRTEQDRA